MILMRQVLGPYTTMGKAWLRQKVSVLRHAAVVLLTGFPPLVSAQQRAAAPASLVFDRVTVVDVKRGTLVADQRVVIAGNRIRAIGAPDEVQIPDGARVVPAAGQYLIPGLWDMHVHPNRSTERVYPLMLAYGVTGFRDANSSVPLDTLRLWRREILAGTRVGPPRQLFVGPALNSAGLPYTMDNCAKYPRQSLCITATDARRIVDSLKAAGADMIKLREASPEVYFAVAAEARRQGLPFGGHLNALMHGQSKPTGGPTALAASDSGATIVDHTNTAAELSGACLGEWGEEVDEAECRTLAEHFRRHGTWWVPTLVVNWDQGLSFGARAESLLARGMERDSLYGFVGDSSSPQQMFVSSLAGTTMSVVQRVGLPILAGTDAGMDTGVAPGPSLHTELALYVAEGLTPLEALQTATLNPAKMLRGTDSLGTVAPGKLADLVLLDANPLADITNTTAIRAVVANGRYYDRAALDQLLAQARPETRAP